MFSVTTVNTDRSLLTLAEIRAAVGVSDGSKDSVLVPLGDRVSATITRACMVSRDGAMPPTLRLEAVSDTYRQHGWRPAQWLAGGQQSLVLSRRPVTTIASVTVDSVVLTADTDYEVDKASGLLFRLSNGVRVGWCGFVVVVAYSAGYETVPDDLKLAASMFVQSLSQQGSRDPLLKRVMIPDVIEKEFWVDPTKDIGVPAEVMDLLRRGGYVNQAVA
jgi:hypothetical protein